MQQQQDRDKIQEAYRSTEIEHRVYILDEQLAVGLQGAHVSIGVV